MIPTGLPALDPVLTLLASYDIAFLVAFGSRVGGSSRSASDLDLGAERRDRARLDHHALGMLQLELGRWAGLTVDLADLSHADALFRFEVVRQSSLLYESTPGAWSGFVARTLIDHDDIAPFLPALLAGVGRAARGVRQ